MSATRSLTLAAVHAVLTCCAGPAAGAITAVPPAQYRPGAVAAKADAALPTAGVRPLRIVLAEPATLARQASPRPDAAVAPGTAPGGAKRRPRIIGYPREVPADSRVVRLDTLAWQAGTGGRVARIEIASPGAAALRLALAL